MASSPRYLAGGTIEVARFVKIDTTADHNFTVVQATGQTDKVIGVSQDGAHDPPGLSGSADDAARDNQTLRVYSVGEECLVTAGAAITQGDYLKSDADGKAVPVTFAEAANIFYGGYALEDGAADELVRMMVLPGTTKPA
jgi:hypothetical protein